MGRGNQVLCSVQRVWLLFCFLESELCIAEGKKLYEKNRQSLYYGGRNGKTNE